MKPFVVRHAKKPVPIIASIPHTGTYVPEAFLRRMASDHIRSLPMTDWHLHELYDFLPEVGVTTIYATCSRFMTDLNRPPEPRALYPGRFETGLVATETFWGDTIWREAPTEVEKAELKQKIHTVYHEKLQQLIDNTINKYGQAILIDCHSIASKASKVSDELIYDIYLGDRDGETNDGRLTLAVESVFKKAGYSVVRNTPYKGGYITDHYGHQEKVQALQIEMCQRLYMDEEDAAGALAHPNFKAMKPVLKDVFNAILAESSR